MKNNVNKTLKICIGTALSMLILSFASVPLYDLFCRVTGYGGTPQVAGQQQLAEAKEKYSSQIKNSDRKIKVRFDANVNSQLPWDFKPLTTSVEVAPGEEYKMFYIATNLTSDQTQGMSTFNVSPDSVGQYFVKLECFCFTEQTLAAGEETKMGVWFYIDPEILEDPDLDGVDSVTLSYTFFPDETGAEG